MTENLNLDNFFGRNLSYSGEKIKSYNRLREDALSPFKGRTMSDIFVYAAIFGFINGRREELKNVKPQISSLALSRQRRAILLSIAISNSGGIDILFDQQKTTKIIEEYANGGIDMLEPELLGNVTTVDAITLMSSRMKEIIDERIKHA